MTHFHARPARRAGSSALGKTPQGRRHYRALQRLVLVMVPLAIWTVTGLVALWPGDISASVNQAGAGSGPTTDGVTYPRARVTAVATLSCDGLPGSVPGTVNTRCATVTATVLEGDDAGTSVSVPLTEAIFSTGTKVGQQIKLVRVAPPAGEAAQYQFSDFARSIPLLVFALIFAAVVVAVARWRGLASLAGLGFTGFLLVKFMFPALLVGENPILVGLFGSAAIMFVVLYTTHGLSARTTTALIGTLFGLVLIALLGWGATRWTHLSGAAGEDDFVLAAAAPDLVLKSVVICGIILAGLGVLNDVTVTQASAVWELAEAGDRPGPASSRILFAQAMRIGRDHIASTIYTIAFASAGATLSVLLLIAVYDRPLLQVLQTEQFADEIVATLVGSIGLVLAMPLTTAVAVTVVRSASPSAATTSYAAPPTA